ncbi:unnamed protein product [Thlaspi arvense]|uniref:Uncharacterized protein n=1 Tax=Thlaspi arvense TaxID=13288 RepID=A0AAU9T986_THLAR|nr:unnamed protein product [Thlaspi arvense]
MVYSRFVFFALLVLFVLLAGVESTNMVSEDSNKEVLSLSNDQSRLGVCKSLSCNVSCLEACGKGGFCEKGLCKCFCQIPPN